MRLLSAAIIAVRESRGETPTQFARTVGCTKKSIIGWESEAIAPDLGHVARLRMLASRAELRIPEKIFGVAIAASMRIA
jgi:DNA-binding XRE family transcriptional regulator